MGERGKVNRQFWVRTQCRFILPSEISFPIYAYVKMLILKNSSLLFPSHKSRWKNMSNSSFSKMFWIEYAKRKDNNSREKKNIPSSFSLHKKSQLVFYKLRYKTESIKDISSDLLYCSTWLGAPWNSEHFPMHANCIKSTTVSFINTITVWTVINDFFSSSLTMYVHAA